MSILIIGSDGYLGKSLKKYLKKKKNFFMKKNIKIFTTKILIYTNIKKK